ncbi:MAG: hypothetical protein AAF755_08445, partial [Pseudomonadota bacterium]
VIALTTTAFADIDGGTGNDTLRFDANGLTLDLTTLNNTALSGIERIDMRPSTGGSVTLDRVELQRLTEAASSTAGTSNYLRVLGDATDTLNLQGGDWTLTGAVTDAEGTFDIYRNINGDAVLEVSQTIAITGGPIAPIELSQVTQNTNVDGYVINGSIAGDKSGYSVSGAGDVNGDGYEDLIIGAPEALPIATASAGLSYVIFGKSDGTIVELSALTAADGFIIDGSGSPRLSGYDVSAAGDVNGDGLADLIVGAPSDSVNNLIAGGAYVVFGKATGTTITLSNLAANEGFAINGIDQFDGAGSAVSTAGDVNGDGLDDLFIGAYGDDPNGPSSGAGFVVFGKTSGTTVELSNVEVGSNNTGFVINGFTDASGNGDRAGYDVSGGGDVNGDGLDDLLINARDADPNASTSGASYVIFGKTSGTVLELTNIQLGTNTDGFVLNGFSLNDQTGKSLSLAGDVNGDGLEDIIIGAPRDDNNGSNSGVSHVVFGKASGTVVELSDIEAGIGGFSIFGITNYDEAGRAVSGAGDINGDGLDDLLIGAYGNDVNGSSSGQSYVVFGKTDTTNVELSDVAGGALGFGINGAVAGDFSGRAISVAGDVNGDGFDDLLIGAREADPNGATAAGASYVVFGGDFNGVTTAVGNPGNNTLTGSTAVDVIVAGLGSDTLIGNGGADVLRGGGGDDILAISDLAFADINGGTGTDTLRLDGSNQTLDLTTLDNTSLTEVERIDLSGNANTLVLNDLELLRLSDTSNTLRVLGTAADTVTVNGPGWASAGTISTFDVYTNGEARLEVAQVATLNISLPPPTVTPVELSAVQQNANPAGFVINGAAANDRSGASVRNAGDVNGDGFDDVIVGSYQAGNNAGAAYVVFGKADGTEINLATLQLTTNNTGFAITGGTGGGFLGDYAGISVSSAGDVNNDGLDDLLVGAYFDDAPGLDTGAAYVVFGKNNGTAVNLATVETNAANSGGFILRGAAGFSSTGISVEAAGDVNGDGVDDVIVGASGLNGGSGAAYVVFGTANTAAIDLSQIALGTNNDGFVINGIGPTFDAAGTSVSGAGDVNGDGLDDIIVGAPNDSPNAGNGNYAGASFVVYGKANGAVVNLSTVEQNTPTSGGFVVNGFFGSDSSGAFVGGGGDVNGDGFDDIIIGARLDDTVNGSGANEGAAYVVFGQSTNAPFELSAVEQGTNNSGFIIRGITGGEYAGKSVSIAGDVNGDGLDDVIVGAYFADGQAGDAYVIFGKTDGGVVDLSTIETGVGGFVLNQTGAGDRAGVAVSGAGDVNGDGFDDLIVGANFDDPASGANAGTSIVVFGGNFTGAATQVGGVGNDTLTGTGGNDNIFAGTGDDTLQTSAGQDRLSGGNGADEFDFLNVTGQTEVIDFVSSEGDQLDVSVFTATYANYLALQAVISANGPGGHDTLIQFDANTSAILIGVEPSDLSAADFIF